MIQILDSEEGMEKIAIRGANGQLGSDIYLCFKENYKIFPLFHEDIEVIQLDSINSCLSKIHPDIIINTAAYHD